MSAAACVMFYGLRFEIDPSDLDGLEARTDPRMVAARSAGLNHYWANFAQPGERYLLFIGTKLAVLGPENKSETSFASRDLQTMMESTQSKLRTAALTGEPLLYVQWAPDA